MPALSNPKHEAIALALFRGMTATDAYEKAGYKRHDGNASRLSGNERIRSRVAELQREAAKRAVEEIAFDAKALFVRLERQIERALDAGDHKTAMDGRKFMLTCFGYEDSPTMTHEHVAGRKIAPDPAPTDGEPDTRNVVLMPERRFAGLVSRMRRKLDERL